MTEGEESLTYMNMASVANLQLCITPQDIWEALGVTKQGAMKLMQPLRTPVWCNASARDTGRSILVEILLYSNVAALRSDLVIAQDRRLFDDAFQ